MAPTLQGPLVWVDLEMTGLDVEKDRIIEVACVVTDQNLAPVSESVHFVLHQPAEVMDAMGAWCKEHHGKSGLTARVLQSTMSADDACTQLMQYVQKYCPERGTALLAGNSVHVDRWFLHKEMRPLLDWLHYRIVDVSTLKELVRRWRPDVFETAPPKRTTHRALDDIFESIAELEHYRKALFNNVSGLSTGKP